jgi:flagella basal body P-ring formation protein FlgA
MKMSTGCAMLAAASLFTACTHAAAAAAPAGDRTLALTLRATVTLGDAALRLGDLVEIAPGNDPALLALPLGQAPRVGHLLRLRRAELETALLRQGILAPIAWQGAQAVIIATRTQRIDPPLLRGAALAHLAQSFASVGDTFDVTMPETAVDIPQRPYQLRARAVDPQAGPRVLVWLDVLVDDAVYRSVVMPATVTRSRTCWVARRPIAGGARVDSADFAQRQVNVAGLGAVVEGWDTLAGTRLRSALREGQVLTVQAVAPVGAVFRGDPVRLTLQAGTLDIEAPGVAQASALPGQLVAVRSASSGEIVSGRLGRAGNVVIE